MFQIRTTRNGYLLTKRKRQLKFISGIQYVMRKDGWGDIILTRDIAEVNQIKTEKVTYLTSLSEWKRKKKRKDRV